MASVFCAFLAATAVCAQPAAETSPTRPLKVVATTPPLADWARNVGGVRCEVTCLLPPGSSAHTFEPAPREMRAVGAAAIFLKVGLELDNWAGRLSRGGAGNLKVVAIGDELKRAGKLPDVTSITLAAARIEAATGHDHDHDHGGTDPHFWLDPRLAVLAVGMIADALAQADPAGAAQYRANAARYAAEIEETDREILRQLSAVGRDGIVTFHNAFAYFAARYGVPIAAVVEEYPGKTPSERYVKGVVAKLRQMGAKRVFAEPQFSPRVAEIIAAEIGGSVGMLDPHGTPGNPERDTYLKILRYNAAQIAGKPAP
jgi:ABC-type Zn uptake system ZnuABC Zn-binding protein ZnuA